VLNPSLHTLFFTSPSANVASPDDLLASYASQRSNAGNATSQTPSFEYDESEGGLGQLRVAERRDIGRPLAGGEQLRPGSIAGGNNPFRQSFVPLLFLSLDNLLPFLSWRFFATMWPSRLTFSPFLIDTV
jgi:hypothetical protein